MKDIVLIKARQVGASIAAQRFAMGIDPIFGILRLIPPYVTGNGADFSDIKIFVEESSCVSGDTLKTPANQSLIVDSVEEVEDFFDSYTVITTRIITPDATVTVDPLLIEQKILGVGSSAAGLWSQMSKANVQVYNPTKVITQLLPQFLKDISNETYYKPKPKKQRKPQRKASTNSLFKPKQSMGAHFQPPRFKQEAKGRSRRSRRGGRKGS